ncbi:hypothetical protein ACGVWS_11885 [Enterobacteriaceae bacterium LUAb1]
MFAETTAAITAAKEAYELIKVLKNARDQTVVDNATGKLHEKIIELQMLNAELASLYHAEKQITIKLASENAKIEMFTAQAAEYEIHKTTAGSIVYRSKSPADNEVGCYYLCAHCYQERKISVLQPTGKTVPCSSGDYCQQSFCPSCNTQFVMHKIPPKERHIPGPVKFRGRW